MISIIISTYDTPEYLEKCLNSLPINTEILVGIDGCKKTLDCYYSLKWDMLYPNVKFFYFKKNCGTYNVKNNLIKETNGNWVLFFDSDDYVIFDISTRINEEYDIIRLKFQDFGSKDDKIEIAQGVFFIKKEALIKMEGFQPWLCNADVEFKMRANFNKLSVKEDNKISFMRRKHDKNLTVSEKTRMKSELRKKYEDIINNKLKNKNWDNPIIEIKEYEKINF